MALLDIVCQGGERLALLGVSATHSGAVTDIVHRGVGLRNVMVLSVPTGVFPVVGHVRSGDAYGPTGTEYTGNETEPAQGDVRNGTQYGAAGTEFTGTLVVGGSSAYRPVGSPVVRKIK